jgi:hypothetical protein
VLPSSESIVIEIADWTRHHTGQINLWIALPALAIVALVMDVRQLRSELGVGVHQVFSDGSAEEQPKNHDRVHDHETPDHAG